MASKKPFTDLRFRGTTWYLAEEVDKKLETIRVWYKAQLGWQVDPQDIRELGEILEAESR